MSSDRAGDTAGADSEVTRQRGSIAGRMLVAAAIWSVLVLVAAGWSLAAFYRGETEQRLDTEVSDTLINLLTAVEPGQAGGIDIRTDKLPNDVRFSRAYSGSYWAILELDDKGEVARFYPSGSLFQARPLLPPGIIKTAAARVSASDPVEHANGVGPDGASLRIGVRRATVGPREIAIYAGADRTAADKAVSDFTWRLGFALLVLALGVIALVLWLIRFGLKPLHQIEDKLGEVRSGRRERLDGEYPRELHPLVKEINTLISHNRKVVERARTHVGNLAHALKTPLAVLKNEAKGEDKLSELVRRQTDAMTANVAHWLRRAQAAAQAEVLGVRTPIKEPVEGIARMLERLHRDKEVAIDVEADPEAVFRGERGDLDDLVGNLLDNAAKWCRRRIEVKVSRTEDGVEVLVDDDGPGLSPENREKAMQRGKRLDESEPGTGLGLSIVRELTDIYGGRFALETSPLGGLRARLTLPAAPL